MNQIPKVLLEAKQKYLGNASSTCLPHMAMLAWRAINEFKMQTTEFACVSIQVDSKWQQYAYTLRPHLEPEWQKIREQGGDPTLIDVVPLQPLYSVLTAIYPKLLQRIVSIPPTGQVKGFFMFSSNIGITNIKPKFWSNPMHLGHEA